MKLKNIDDFINKFLLVLIFLPSLKFLHKPLVQSFFVVGRDHVLIREQRTEKMLQGEIDKWQRINN